MLTYDLYFSTTFCPRIYCPYTWCSHCPWCLSVANGSFTSPKTCGANGSNGNPAQCRCTAVARAQDRPGLISPARKPVMNWAMRKLELLLAQLPWTNSWFQRRKLPALIGIRLQHLQDGETVQEMNKLDSWFKSTYLGLKRGLNNFWRPSSRFARFLWTKRKNTPKHVPSCWLAILTLISCWGESTKTW